MSGTRALFASIGASVSIVAAAALSLLAVSAVFAFGGWAEPVAQSARGTALVLDEHRSGAARATPDKPIVVPARAQAPAPREVVRVSARPQAAVPAADRAAIEASALAPPKAAYDAPKRVEPRPQPDVTPPAPAAPKKSAADGVRTAGEGLSGTVQGTAGALAQVTDPLLAPVAAATQRVLNALAELLRRSTDGLAGTGDGVLAPPG